jgi:hypothetical protein
MEDIKIGGLYRLNPKYDHGIGKRIYPFNKLFFHGTEEAALIKSEWMFSCDTIMIIEKNLTFPKYSDSRYIKFLLNDMIYVFPISIYHPDIVIEVKADNI